MLWRGGLKGGSMWGPIRGVYKGSPPPLTHCVPAAVAMRGLGNPRALGGGFGAGHGVAESRHPAGLEGIRQLGKRESGRTRVSGAPLPLPGTPKHRSP